MKRLTKHAQALIGQTIEIKWGTSRGRDTYGYTTATLYHQGRRIAGCNGGGYDMRGTVVGNWIAYTFPDELRALKPEQMEERFHWQPDRTRVCTGQCRKEYETALMHAIERGDRPRTYPQQVRLSEDAFTCPKCGADTRTSGDGKRVSEGRQMYGLRFYDPKYDPLDAKLEHADDTFTKPDDVGKTYRRLQAEGKIVDLNIIRAAYSQSSPHATKRHTHPSIDGGCGFECVRRILQAIGLDLRQVHDSKRLDVYTIQKHMPNA